VGHCTRGCRNHCFYSLHYWSFSWDFSEAADEGGRGEMSVTYMRRLRYNCLNDMVLRLSTKSENFSIPAWTVRHVDKSKHALTWLVHHNSHTLGPTRTCSFASWMVSSICSMSIASRARSSTSLSKPSAKTITLPTSGRAVVPMNL